MCLLCHKLYSLQAWFFSRHLVWCTLFISLFSGVAAAATFKDSFTGSLDKWGAAHGNWQTSDGVLIQKAEGHSPSISFPIADVTNFDLSYTAIFDELSPSTRTGLTIDRGIGYWLISVQGDGAIIWAFIVKGEKSGLFHGSDRLAFQKGVAVEINVVCKNRKLALHINGKEYIVGPASGNGKIRLKANPGLRIDDVYMTYETGDRQYPNLQINSSFEYATNPDIPDYWTQPSRWTRMNHGLPHALHSKTGIAELREKWVLDDETAFDGSRSLRIQKPFIASSFPMRVVPDSEYMISVYLKSDRPQLPVRIAADFRDRTSSIASQELQADATWKRHVFHIQNYPYDQLSLSIAPQSEGVLWVDAVQIERGNQVTAYTPNWYDAGFSLPKVEHAFRPPPSSYRDKTHKVLHDSDEIKLSRVELQSSDPSADRFSLKVTLKNTGNQLLASQLTTTVEIVDHETQLRNRSITLAGGESKTFSIPDLTIANNRHRSRIMLLISDAEGKPLRQDRLFRTVPHPFRIYPEFSHYTDEKSARIAAVFDGDIPSDAYVEIKTKLAMQPNEVMGKTEIYPVQEDEKHQRFSLPINTPGWHYDVPYTLYARLLRQDGTLLASSTCQIITRQSQTPDIRINHINRGLYLNGEPYIPYGVSYIGSLPGKEQIVFNKSCGFTLITALSHRSTIEQVESFLSSCEETGIKACLTHLGRKYSVPSTRLLEAVGDHPALVLFTPSDETGLRETYEDLRRAEQASPNLIHFINENTAGYQKYSDQLRGFPGPMISCDRYPLIHQAYGWPQTRTDVNGIYSYEERIEWMNQDGIRDRKPLHFFLQGAEHRTRLPTPEELTWMVYIPLVNNCLAFTYFAGIPQSAVTLEAMIRLNQEVQELKPALFSLEKDPIVTAMDDTSALHIRVLAKQLEDEIIVICVNRAVYPVTANVDLSDAGVDASSLVQVMFEDRSLQLKNGKLQDHFQGLERHVYKINRNAKSQ